MENCGLLLRGILGSGNDHKISAFRTDTYSTVFKETFDGLKDSKCMVYAHWRPTLQCLHCLQLSGMKHMGLSQTSKGSENIEHQ